MAVVHGDRERTHGDLTVLAIDHTAELGGAELGLLNLAAGFGPTMRVALFEDGPFAELLRSRGVGVDVLGVAPSRPGGLRRSSRLRQRAASVLRLLPRLRRELKTALAQVEPDVLLLNTLRATVLVALCGVGRGVPRIVMVRDGLRPPYLSFFDALLAQAAVASSASVVVCNSPWTAAALRVPRPRRVVHPAIDDEFFSDPVPRVTEPLRVLILGRVAPWKGQLLGLDAVGRVSVDRPWSVTVAGGPWFGETAYYDQVLRAAEAATEVDVQVLGHVSKVKELIDAHDVVLHTSTAPEPFGQVVVQAMARGRMVIAADAGGPSSIVSDGESGVLYPPGDVAALAEALTRALSDDEWRWSLGAGGVEAAQRFRPADAVSALAEIIETKGGRRRTVPSS